MRYLCEKIKNNNGTVVVIFASYFLFLFIPMAAFIYDINNIYIMKQDMKNMAEMSGLSCVAGAKNKFNESACIDHIKRAFECNRNGLKGCGSYTKNNSKATDWHNDGPPVLIDTEKEYESRKLYRLNQGVSSGKAWIQVCGTYKPFFIKHLKNIDVCSEKIYVAPMYLNS